MQNEAAILRKQISEGYDGEKKTSARRTALPSSETFAVQHCHISGC